MASVKLKLKESQKLKNGNHPIIIQVLKDTKKAIATIGLSCNINDWNHQLNLPKNRRLSIVCQKELLRMEELLYQGVDQNWTVKKIVDIFKGKDTKELMFFEYFTKIDFEQKKGISTHLLDGVKLRKFKKYLGKEDIPFKEIDFNLLRDYKKHLEKEGLKSATRYLSIIRQVYNYAIESDDYIPVKNPFKSSLFVKKITASSINRNLSIEITKKLFELDYKDGWKISYKEMALDFWKFLFLMRGINLIEMVLMKKEDVSGDYFVFTREKLKNKINTKQKVKIVPEARLIIERYANPKNEYVFPILENGYNKDKNIRDYKKYVYKTHTINTNLRKIGEELELNFNLTTMSARYTFINLAKQNEVPFLYLQELIGHKTKTTTDIYLDVFPQSKIDEYHQKVIDLILKNVD